MYSFSISRIKELSLFPIKIDRSLPFPSHKDLRSFDVPPTFEIMVSALKGFEAKPSI